MSLSQEHREGILGLLEKGFAITLVRRGDFLSIVAIEKDSLIEFLEGGEATNLEIKFETASEEWLEDLGASIGHVASYMKKRLDEMLPQLEAIAESEERSDESETSLD